jgi:hypothetical protein
MTCGPWHVRPLATRQAGGFWRHSCSLAYRPRLLPQRPTPIPPQGNSIYNSATRFEDLPLSKDLLKVRKASRLVRPLCAGLHSLGPAAKANVAGESFQQLSYHGHCAAGLHRSQGLYVDMKFERPSKIQALTLPMILTPPFKDLIAQVSTRHTAQTLARAIVLLPPYQLSPTCWERPCFSCCAGAQRLRQDNVLRAVHAVQVRPTARRAPPTKPIAVT